MDPCKISECFVSQQNTKQLPQFLIYCKNTTNFCQLVASFHAYLGAKKSTSSLNYFPWDITKILWNFFFGYFGHAWLHKPRVILSICRKLLLICRQKKQLHPLLPSPFLEILQRYANLCWVLWSWLVAHTQNDIISLQKTSMFICMPKINFSIHFFLEIYILKNPAIWLADSILAHNSRTRILPDMGLVVKYQQ